jgi:hypothetical protein
LNSFSAQVSSPYAIPLIGYPKAWSPSTHGVVNADVVYLDAKDDASFETFKGKLKGKIVLISDIRPMKADFEGIGKRVTDEELTKMAAAPDPATVPRPTPGGTPSPEMAARMAAFQLVGRRMLFAYNEGAAMIVENSRGALAGRCSSSKRRSARTARRTRRTRTLSGSRFTAKRPNRAYRRR